MKLKIVVGALAIVFILGITPVLAADIDVAERLTQIKEEIALLQTELAELEKEYYPEAQMQEAAPDFTNADDAPLNSVYHISAADTIENTPYGNGISSGAGYYSEFRSMTGYLEGILSTVGPSETMKTQTFVSINPSSPSSPEPSLVYFRSSNGGVWTRWHRLSDDLSLSSSNIAIRKKMICRYVDDDGNPTAEDTGTLNPQYMVDDRYIFSDFNNAPKNSIYQIDMDCDATVMANNPLAGKSCILITTGFSYSSRHGQIQLCMGLDGRGTSMYYRYGYYQTLEDYRWSPWEKVAVPSNPGLTLASGSPDEVTISAKEFRILLDEVRQAYTAVTDGFLEIAPSGMEQGSYAYSAKIDYPGRIRCKKAFKVPEGAKVVFSNPTLNVYFGLMESPTSQGYLQYTGWIGAGNVAAEYDIMFDGYLNIIFESPDGREITPADYDGYVKLIY
ncbi:MAG: hypothetical protein IKE58_09255 [Blautia sp.]|nr:hypothetical protein [Blautia sp.]